MKKTIAIIIAIVATLAMGCMAQPTGSNLYTPDSDGDGWTPLSKTQAMQAGVTETQLEALLLNDCDDTDATVYPGAPEVCDGQDNDCDGEIDEGLECECTQDADCDDLNPCTDNTCVDGTCQSANNVEPCDDSDACTVDDMCADGECVPGEAPDCDDSDACTVDSCNPLVGCTNMAMNCDDGSFCTDDSCDPATGCVNTDIDCDDGDVCTADSCDPAIGCVNTPIEGCCVTDVDCTDLVPVDFTLVEKKDENDVVVAIWWHLGGESFGCIQGTCDTCTDLDNDGACGGVLPCVPACDGMECGSDGCGGSCGNCEEGFICEVGLCEAVAPVQPEGTGDCSDGLDNDEDGLTDCEEASCDGAICGVGMTCQQGVCADNPAPEPETFVTIAVSAPTPASVWMYYGAGEGENHLAPYSLELTETQACTWGVEIAAQTPSGFWPWYGCDAGISLDTLVVTVDDVVVQGTLVKHPWVCGGNGEGNLFLSPTQLGCPQVP
jgi:hypothetical protein